MGYRVMGLAHAGIHRALHATRERLGQAAGQGTVEYVALMLLVAALLAGVVTAAKGMKDGGIASTVAAKVKEAIDGVK
jgi:hypothetical protein